MNLDPLLVLVHSFSSRVEVCCKGTLVNFEGRNDSEDRN
jgi:hypothetical protein